MAEANVRRCDTGAPGTPQRNYGLGGTSCCSAKSTGW
jgi:hypothetical protein